MSDLNRSAGESGETDVTGLSNTEPEFLEEENTPEENSVLSTMLPESYVPVFDSPDYETGEIVCATLSAEGIHAVMQNPHLGPGTNVYPPLGLTWSHAVYVAPEDVEAAKAVLGAASPTEEELIAEEEADPTTLEEAETRVRNA